MGDSIIIKAFPIPYSLKVNAYSNFANHLRTIATMNITLTPAQENLVQSKISTGKYRSMQEVIEIALLLFDEYEQAESEWSLSVRDKIQAAIAMSEQVPPVDGESFVQGILERFKRA